MIGLRRSERCLKPLLSDDLHFLAGRSDCEYLLNVPHAWQVLKRSIGGYGPPVERSIYLVAGLQPLLPIILRRSISARLHDSLSDISQRKLLCYKKRLTIQAIEIKILGS